VRRKAVDNLTLMRWRAIDAVVVLGAIADHLKQDAEFRPLQSHGTTRWHASIAGHDHEVLCTGPRFFDARANRGGGGAVDLVMHLLGLDFKHAVKVLQDRRL
jgi:hypothetical protein